MIEAGKYYARAVGAAVGKANTGTDQIAVQFEITSAGEFTGHSITWYGYFTDAAFNRTIESLRTAGWKGTDLADLSDFGPDNQTVCEIVIEHEPDQNGKLRARVKWVNRENGGGPALKNQLAGNDLKSFAARMKGKIVAFDKQAGGGAPAQPARPAPRPAPQQSRNPAPTEEDIPF